jgi:endonuclease YncB( thermonuclease family)
MKLKSSHTTRKGRKGIKLLITTLTIALATALLILGVHLGTKGLRIVGITVIPKPSVLKFSQPGQQSGQQRTAHPRLGLHAGGATEMLNHIFLYEAVITRPVDGDSIYVDLDMGRNIWAKNVELRLAGINAPEKKGATLDAGLAAEAFLNSILPTGRKVDIAEVEYHEFEKFGRDLCVIYLTAPKAIDWDGANLTALMPGSVNQQMIDNGHAVYYNPDHL